MLLANGVVRRSSDLIENGVHPKTLAGALEKGVISRLAHGAYHLADAAPEAWMAALASACVRMPDAVICLTSAAHMELLIDAHPPKIWLALPQQVHAAKLDEVPHRFMRWSYEGALQVGVITDRICDVTIRRTNAARTVVDLIRYGRHFGGPDIGIEAAKRAVLAGTAPDEILGIAKQLRTPSEAMRTIEILVNAVR